MLRGMIKSTANGLKFGQFKLLLNYPEITHGTFTRHGGLSQAPFDALNAGSNDGMDAPAAIQENRHRILTALDLPRLVDCDQEHKDNVFIANANTLSSKIYADILLTDLKNVGLMIKHADCQAALFYDPKNQVIGNVHAGWRGSVSKVYTKTVKAMQAQFGSSPSDLIVCISPSLGPDHAEFKNYRTELPATFWNYQVKPLYFDFWAIAEAELIEAGIQPSHIEIARECTYSNPADYFSYRRDKVTGRNATIIGLKR